MIKKKICFWLSFCLVAGFLLLSFSPNSSFRNLTASISFIFNNDQPSLTEKESGISIIQIDEEAQEKQGLFVKEGSITEKKVLIETIKRNVAQARSKDRVVSKTKSGEDIKEEYRGDPISLINPPNQYIIGPNYQIDTQSVKAEIVENDERREVELEMDSSGHLLKYDENDWSADGWLLISYDYGLFNKPFQLTVIEDQEVAEEEVVEEEEAVEESTEEEVVEEPAEEEPVQEEEVVEEEVVEEEVVEEEVVQEEESVEEEVVEESTEEEPVQEEEVIEEEVVEEELVEEEPVEEESVEEESVEEEEVTEEANIFSILSSFSFSKLFSRLFSPLKQTAIPTAGFSLLASTDEIAEPAEEPVEEEEAVEEEPIQEEEVVEEEPAEEPIQEEEVIEEELAEEVIEEEAVEEEIIEEEPAQEELVEEEVVEEEVIEEELVEEEAVEEELVEEEIVESTSSFVIEKIFDIALPVLGGGSQTFNIYSNGKVEVHDENEEQVALYQSPLSDYELTNVTSNYTSTDNSLEINLSFDTLEGQAINGQYVFGIDSDQQYVRRAIFSLEDGQQIASINRLPSLPTPDGGLWLTTPNGISMHFSDDGIDQLYNENHAQGAQNFVASGEVLIDNGLDVGQLEVVEDSSNKVRITAGGITYTVYFSGKLYVEHQNQDLELNLAGNAPQLAFVEEGISSSFLLDLIDLNPSNQLVDQLTQDYNNPDELEFLIGQSGGEFSAAEGYYPMIANGDKVEFWMDGIAHNRFYPVFQIENWNSKALPNFYAELEGETLEPEIDYIISFKDNQPPTDDQSATLIFQYLGVIDDKVRFYLDPIVTWDGEGGDNNWSTAANWSGDSLPGTGDIATFDSTSTDNATIDANIDVGGIDINSGYTGVITQGSSIVTVGSSNYDQAAGTFTGGSGKIDVNGNLTISGGTFTSTSGVLEVSGQLNRSAGTFTHNSGTVILNATANQTITNSQSFNNLTINDGLIGYWKLDESSGTTAADSSGYGNDGTWINGPTASSTTPTVNFTNPYSLSFDGTNDKVDFATPSEIDKPLNDIPSLTFTVWAKPNSCQAYGAVVCFGDTFDFEVSPLGDGENSFGIWVNDQALASTYTSCLDHVGKWVHLTVTKNANNYSLFVNGEIVGSEVDADNLDIGSTSHLGTNGDTGYFDGLIDDVRVYDRVLSASEVSSLANGYQSVTASTTQTLGAALDITGDLTLAAGALDVSASNYAISVAGSWNNYGGVFTPRTGTVTLDGTASGKNILSGKQDFNNLTVNGSGGAWTLGDNLTASTTLSIANGTLDVSTSNYRIKAGTVTQSGGTLTARSGDIIIDASSNKTLTITDTVNNLRIEDPSEDGLVGYWKFDEGTGTTAKDSSGNGNDGTLTNGPLWSSTVNATTTYSNLYSLDFDGTNDYVNLPSGVGLNSQGTVSLWAKFDNTTGPGHLWVDRQDGNNENRLLVQSDSIIFTGYDNSAYQYSLNSSVTTGTWYNIIGVFQDNDARLYVDGVLAGSDTSVNMDSYTHNETRLGHYSLAGDYFNGLMDDVRIYNKALTASEVSNLANGRYADGTSSTATFTLGGNLDVNGSLSIDSGTLDASASNYAISVAGSWNNYGGVFTSRTGTVTLDGTASGKTILSGKQDFNNLTVNGSGGAWTLSDNLTASTTLSIANGTLDVSTSNYRIKAGTVIQSGGTLTTRSGDIIIDASSNKTLTITDTVNNLRIEDPSEDGLVGYWKFDEGVGTTAKDSSGNGNDGTLTNGPLWSSTVNATTTYSNIYSLDFDGTNDYVDAGSSVDDSLDTEYSLSAWIYATDLSNEPQVLLNRIAAPVLFHMSVSPAGSGAFVIRNNSSLLVDAVTPDSSVTTNNWHHLVGVRNGNDLSIYLDGVHHETDTGSLGSGISHDSTTYIGRYSANENYNFTGKIDEVRIYNKALTASEVSNLANGRYANGTSSTATFTLGGNLDVNGSFNIDSGTIDTSSYTADFASLVTLSGGDGSYTGGSGMQTFSSGITIASSTFTGGSGKIDVNGNLTISGGTFTSTSGVLEVLGQLNRSAGTFTHNSGTVMLNATANQTITNSQSFNNLTINDGLVGYWKFDESSGTTAADSSGYGNDGTWTGGPTASSTTPTVNFTNPYSLSFDGTNDYVDMGDDSSLDLTSAITVSAWFKPDVINQQVDILSRDDGVNRNFWVYLENDETIHWSMVFSGTAKDTVSTSLYSAGSWMNVVGTFNGTDRMLYIDGVREANTAESGTIDNDDVSFTIGAREDGLDRLFNGLIDDVRVYNRALTATEVSSLANGYQSVTASTTQTLGAALDITGDLTLAAGALDVSASNYAISVAGSWNNYGGVFTPRTGTVTLDGTASGKNILSGKQDFNNLTVNGSGGAWTLGDNLTASTTLSIANGTLDVSTSNYRIKAGTVTQSGGTLTARSGDIIIDASSNKTLTITDTVNNLRIEDPSEDGLVGYWKFDEGTGTTAKDSSGNGNDGTLTNGPLWSSTVNATTTYSNLYSLDFDGTNDYVEVSGLNIDTRPITLSAWFKLDTDTVSGNIIDNNNGVAYGQGFQTVVSSNELRAIYFQNVRDTGYIILKDQWYNVTASWTDSKILTYVNGTLIDDFSYTVSPHSSSNTGFRIGADGSTAEGYTAVQFANGHIDEVRVYNKALTASEVSNLANGRYANGTSLTATFTLGGNLDVNGSLSIDSGILDASASNYDITLAGDWNNYASSTNAFVPRSATTTLDGTNQTIRGANTFNNLVKIVTSAATLTFENTVEQTVQSLMRFKGAAGQLLSLRSSETGTQWKIDSQGTRSIAYLDVKDSNSTNATPIAAGDFNITDSGNLTNWALNTEPTATTPTSISQATSGNGYLTFATTIADADSDETKVKVEYSDDNGSTWYDPDLVSVTPSQGAVDIDDAQTYQLGTVNGIDTDSANTTLTIVWDTQSASNANGAIADRQTDIKVRITANDGTADSTVQTSSAFEVDNVSPTGLGSITGESTNTLSGVDVAVSWSAASDDNFDRYDIWYGKSQSDVNNRTGSASNANTTDLSKTLTALERNTTYYIKIFASDTLGNEQTQVALEQSTLIQGGSMLIPGPAIQPQIVEKPTLIDKIVEKIEEALTPAARKELIEAVTVKPPVVFRGQWSLVAPRKPLQEFVLKPLPKDITNLTQKFPRLGKTLRDVGVTRVADITKLKAAKFNLPRLAEVATLRPIVKPTPLTPLISIPVAKLSTAQIAKIPTGVVFARDANEKIDLNINFALNEQGEVRQTLNVTAGQSMKLIVKPEMPAEIVKGYILHFSEEQFTQSDVPLASLMASQIFAGPKFVKNQVKPVNKRLVLKEFTYRNMGNNVFMANIQVPKIGKKYEIKTIIDYIDPQTPNQEVELITVIDPEGYVYSKVKGQELRIKNVTVSLFWQNPETKQYQLWPADDFQQQNPQVTDKTGQYTFLVPEGNYYTTAKATGYALYKSDSFLVKRGSGIHMNIELKEKFFLFRLLDWFKSIF
jgi:hypothetical protein